jgi:amino acid transporter
VLIVSFVITYGATFVDPENWSRDFFPFGFSGVLRGSSFVFFAYVGFDSLANFGEESKNPSIDIPVSIVGSLGTCL